MKYTKHYTQVFDIKTLKEVDKKIGRKHDYLYRNNLSEGHLIALNDNTHISGEHDINNCYYSREGYTFVPIPEILNLTYEIY